MSDDEPEHIICATYTHARRHPMVLGNIGGWTPPFQLSMPQLAVLAITLLVEFQTWQMWGAYLPRGLGVFVAVALPCVLAWAVRRARFEGRSLLRTAVGFSTLISSSYTARVGGKPYKPASAASLRKCRVFVAPDTAFPPSDQPLGLPAPLPALPARSMQERSRP